MEDFRKIQDELNKIDLDEQECWCMYCGKQHKLGVCEFEGLCKWCKTRPATLKFGDMLYFTHGGQENCCEICSTRMQLEHAKERAKVVEELEAKLQGLLEAEGSFLGGA